MENAPPCFNFAEKTPLMPIEVTIGEALESCKSCIQDTRRQTKCSRCKMVRNFKLEGVVETHSRMYLPLKSLNFSRRIVLHSSAGFEIKDSISWFHGKR